MFELNQDTPDIHPWYTIGPNASNICCVIVFTSENCKRIGQGHPSSNLTKTVLRYIHCISLGPMRLIVVELSCIKAKSAHFHEEINPHDLEK